MFEKYKSPFGYQVGDNGIDSYGVDHRNFSLRDEIEYQTARDNRESQMMQMYNQQGITDNYPQYTTNFWGDAGNNYGFGSSNISQNIQKMTDPFNNGNFAGSFTDYYANGTNGFSSNGNGNSFGSGSNFGSNNTNSNRYSWSSGYSTTPTLQTRTPTPWSSTTAPTYTTQTPWQNNQTLTPWNGGYDLSRYPQSNVVQNQKNGFYNASDRGGISFKDIYYSKYDSNGNRIYKGIADEEGGFSNRAVDTPTNYGITQAALDEYNNWNSTLRTMYNLPENVKLLKPEQAEKIMDEMYHQRYSINKINRLPIAANVTDHIINGGTDAGWLLADTINDYKKMSYPRNTIISDNLASEINNLPEDEVIPVNDLYTRRRMDRYFGVIDNKPEKINNLNNWYDRIKKFHSSQDEFDRLYKSRKEEYFRKYKTYYTGK